MSYMFEGKEKQMEFTTNKATGWKIVGTMFVSEVEEAAQPVFNMAAIILTGALIIGGILIFFIIRSITKPLSTLVSSSKKISQEIWQKNWCPLKRWNWTAWHKL